jgi:hypothetical protein
MHPKTLSYGAENCNAAARAPGEIEFDAQSQSFAMGTNNPPYSPRISDKTEEGPRRSEEGPVRYGLSSEKPLGSWPARSGQHFGRAK